MHNVRCILSRLRQERRYDHDEYVGEGVMRLVAVLHHLANIYAGGTRTLLDLVQGACSNGRGIQGFLDLIYELRQVRT